MLNIPFERKSFFKFLIGILALTALGFLVSVLGFEYEMTTADPFCAPIAAALLAYFLHLMFWPEED